MDMEFVNKQANLKRSFFIFNNTITKEVKMKVWVKILVCVLALGLIGISGAGCQKAQEMAEKAKDAKRKVEKAKKQIKEVKETAEVAKKAAEAKLNPEESLKNEYNTLKKAFEGRDYDTIWKYMTKEAQQEVLKMVPEAKKAYAGAKDEKDKKEFREAIKLKEDDPEKIGGPNMVAFIVWMQEKMGKGKDFGKSFIGQNVKSVTIAEDKKSGTVETDKGVKVDFIIQDGTWRRKPAGQAPKK